MSRSWIVRIAIAFAAVAVAAPASAQRSHYQGAQQSALRFWIGLFEPRADSTYWDESFDVFTGGRSDFEDAVVGVDYKLALGGRTGILFSGAYYDGSSEQAYRDFVDSFGDPIVHRTSLEIASATAAFVVDLAGGGAAVVPYVGAGGGIYAWRLEESGDFIDFFPAEPELFSATFADEGDTLGWFALAGLEVPLGPRWSFFAEGRWQRLDEELGGDFADVGKLDLSGPSFIGGAAWRF
jgi:hypothetical protein